MMAGSYKSEVNEYYSYLEKKNLFPKVKLAVSE